MNIDRSNYELHIVDYLDGKLDAGQVAELMLFLAENPDLMAEFDLLTSGSNQLTEEAELMPEKEGLKKNLSAGNKEELDHLLVARLEGDITPAQEQFLLEQFSVHPGLDREWKLLLQSRLEPDLSIQFPGKKALKKAMLTLRVRYAAVSAAAVILLAAGLYLLRPVQPVASPVSGYQLSSTLNNPEKTPVASPGNTGIAVVNTYNAHTGAPEAVHATARDGRKEILEITPVKQLAYVPGTRDISLKQAPSMVSPLAAKPAPVQPADEKFNTIEEIIASKIRENKSEVLDEENPGSNDKSGASLSDAGALALRAINKLSGRNFRMKRKYDDKGNVIGHGVASTNFEFYSGK